MRTHTSQFKNELKNMGRQIDSIITYGNTTLHDELYAVTPHFEASLLKSVMKQLDIESSVIIPIGTTVNYQLGVKVGNAYEYMNYGNYVVYSIEKIEDTDTYKMICYDKMLYSMKEYESLGVIYPINIRNFINALCTKVGLVFKDTATQFANYDKIIENELYLDADGNSLGYTYRDVFDELAQVTASIICIDPATDKVQIKYPNQTNDTIDEEFLKDVNVKFGEKYGPVNTIVLSRSAGADNVYYPDPLPQNPCEIKITDNQIMNWNDRDIYLPDIYNKLNGLEYYINDFSSTGILYYELGDFYNVSVGSTTYKCLMLNDEINVTQGIEELIHTEILEEAQTDYTKADKTDRRINQTYLIVDKQNQKIDAVINTTQEIEREFETLQDIDGFAEGKYIYLDDASDELITSAKFNGETSQATRSGKNLFNKNGNTLTSGVTKTVLDTGIRATLTASGNYRYMGIEVGGSELLGKTITLSATITPSASNLGCIALYFGSSSSMAVSSAGLTITATGSKTKTLVSSFPENCDRIYVLVYGNLNGTSNANDYVDYTNLQIEIGSEATSYEPYGAMPSPDYPSEIENVKGKNLLKSIDNSQTINGITFTLNEDKSITVNGTATANALITVYGAWNGTTIYQKLNPDKYYTISGSTNSNIQIFTRITNGSTISSHTPQTNPTFTGQTGIVNYFIQVLSGAVCDNITIKPQLEEGSKATSYVPYNSLEVKVVNKNIFDEILENGGFDTNGINGENAARIRSKNYISIKENTSYAISVGENNTGKTLQVSISFYNSSDFVTPRISFINWTTLNKSVTFTTPANCKYMRFLISYTDSSAITINDNFDKFMVEKGEPTEYEEHQEQTVYFPLAEGQKLYEGSYLADDGIHNVRGQIIYDGSSDEVWYKGSYPITGTVQMQIQKPANFFTETGEIAVTKLNCSHFKSENVVVNGMAVGGYFNVYPSTSLNINTAAEFKTWLSNNPMTLEYPLVEEEVIPYNTEQQAAWNSIKSLHTYKTVTHIYSDAYAEIGYIKDNMLSAFETKASARLTQQDVQQLKIENGRISSEVSSTQSSLNNYYTKNEADNNTNSTKAELENIIQQNKTEVEQTTQALNLRVSSIETNGVDKIETSMGYTFNNDGLNIDKEGAATASTIDNEAFKVKNKSANENVFFAGYVSDQDSAYRGQTIVESTNLVVKNYLNIEGASRFQPYVNQTLGGHGTGAFDIG